MLTPPEIAALKQAIATARLYRDFESSDALQQILDRFGLLVVEQEEDCAIAPRDEYLPPEPTIEALLMARDTARSLKDWESSDRLRDEIQRRTGKRVVDGKDGQRLV